MVTIDLITGFLGSGKTTVIKKYASWLMEREQNIGILENDFGAVNVDMMLLQDLEGELCELEMVAGGCDYDCHRRRFKTKLIAMGMCGYDRVLVEPSGIFDVDEFFDVLREEPLDRWYRIGSVICVVDAGLEEDLSPQAEYLLASQLSNAGVVVMTKTDLVPEQGQRATLDRINRILAAHGVARRFSMEEILRIPFGKPDGEMMEKLAGAGSVTAHLGKFFSEDREDFDTCYFMKLEKTEEELAELIRELFSKDCYGKVFRVKGFCRGREGWKEINATGRELRVSPVGCGQDVLIVIGERLEKEKIEEVFGRKQEGEA